MTTPAPGEPTESRHCATGGEANLQCPPLKQSQSQRESRAGEPLGDLSESEDTLGTSTQHNTDTFSQQMQLQI